MKSGQNPCEPFLATLLAAKWMEKVCHVLQGPMKLMILIFFVPRAFAGLSELQKHSLQYSFIRRLRAALPQAFYEVASPKDRESLEGALAVWNVGGRSRSSLIATAFGIANLHRLYMIVLYLWKGFAKSTNLLNKHHICILLQPFLF